MKLNKISSALKVSNRTSNNLFVFGAALTAMLTMSVYAAENKANIKKDTKTKAKIEVIEVTGMLSSLKAAALLKRTDDRIADAIVAEDIGKLPDNNIAEALQRVTGVSINRDFGVGNAVSIRGLPQNRVELNGRSTIGDSRNGVSFVDFPASFLKSVEVIKSPTPEMIEGALGGTISMQTVRPLDLKKPIAAFSLDGEYADKTRNTAPIFSGSAGGNWDLGDMGTFGIMGMVAFQDRKLRRDEFFNRIKAYDYTSISGIDSPSTKTPSGKYIVADQNTVEQKTERRKRSALNLSLQWAPASGDGNFYIDLSSTDRSGYQDAYSILDVGGSIIADSRTTVDQYGQLNNYTLHNAFTIPKTWSEFRKTKSSSNAIGGEWHFTDKLEVSGEYSVANSKSNHPKSEFNLRPINLAAWNAWTTNYDGSAFNSSLLRFTSDAYIHRENGKVPSVVYSDGLIASQAQNLAVRDYFYTDKNTENNEKAFRLDVKYSEPFGLDFVTSIKTGVRLTNRQYNYNESAYKAKDLYKKMIMQDRNGNNILDSNGFTIPVIIGINDVAALYPGSVNTINYSNSFDQTGLSGANNLLTYRVYDGQLLGQDANESFRRVQNMVQGTNYQTTGNLASNMTANNKAFRDITEKTTAIYLQANLDFDVVRAVVGGRYIKTKLTSKAYEQTGIVDGSTDYNDFLPSLNVTYGYSDETIVRFAAAKVMRRADFVELSPAFNYDNSYVTATRGNINLQPYRATQYDISVEHYFGEGNMVSMALFYKNVASFLSTQSYCAYDAAALALQNQTEFQNICIRPDATSETSDIITTDSQSQFNAYAAAGRTGINTSIKKNGQNGKVQGLELGYQQTFDFLPGALSGLGLSANYTYADSAQPNGNQLLDISKNTFNAQLYWEYERVALRLAYTFRDRFLDTEAEKRVATIGVKVLNSATNDVNSALYDPSAGNNYRNNTSQLDFSASWNINDNFTLVGNVTNLTGKPVSFSTALGSTWKYSESDRRFSVGVRAKF